MVVPDTAMIAEVLLFTCGFTTAPILAAKLTKLYEMAAVQLSQEVMYAKLSSHLCVVFWLYTVHKPITRYHFGTVRP